MRVALLLVLLTLLPLAGASASERPDAQAEDRLVSLSVSTDPFGVFLAQMEHQGALPLGVLSTPPGEDASARSFRPPELTYRDFHASCDLNGDGVGDLISNDLELSRPPRVSGAPSKIVAVDGATGQPIWKRDNLYFLALNVAPDVSYVRVGEPSPDPARNVLPAGDLNGDGACDLYALAFDRDHASGINPPPFMGSPSVTNLDVFVYAISGKDGKDLWKKTITADQKHVDDAPPILSGFTTVSADTTTNFPTGFAIVNSSKGMLLALKTTDVTQTVLQDPLGVERFNILGKVRSPFRSPLYFQSMTIAEHVTLFDGKGSALWTRDIAGASDAKVTNVTWVAGSADLDGDGYPEVLLDQVAMENPRGTSFQDPTSGKPLAEYARGMNVLALDGKTGAIKWTSVIVDATAPRPNPPGEEGFETLMWEQANPLRDVDGDGKPDVMATWVAQEESLPGTPNGLRRTHFVPLHGANGTPIWDVKLPGWGRADTLDGDTGNGTATLVGLGLVDIPQPTPPGGRFPPKSVRLAVVDARTGASRWTYEKSFAENSYLAFNLALAQYQDALAPVDLDGDGIRDLVTPAQPATTTGRDQVLLATSSHTYEVRSGKDGDVLASVRAWGPDGRVLACGGDPANLTVVSGHSRRFDITRFDLRTQNQSWRVPVYNDPAPRAASAGVDIVALGPGCQDHADGSAFVWADAQLFSFERRHEVVPIHGLVTANGTAAWIRPNVTGAPSTTPIFLASVDVPEPPAGPRVAMSVAIGAAVGASLGVVVVTILSRLPLRLLGVGLVLVVLLAPGVGALGLVAHPVEIPHAAAPAPAPSAPTPIASAPTPVETPKAPTQAAAAQPRSSPALIGGSPDERLAIALADPNLTARARMDAVESYLGARGVHVSPGANSTESVFDSNATMVYPWALPDINGDGKSDVLLDTYCTDFISCDQPVNLPQDAARELAFTCGDHHHVFGVDATDGTILWDVNLDMAAVAIEQCGRAFVLGTFPFASDRAGVLVYKLLITDPTLVGDPSVFQHEIVMLDAKTGAPLWSWTGTGTQAYDLLGGGEGRAIIAQPLLMVPGPSTPKLPASAKPAIFVESVGFSYREVTQTNFGSIVTGTLGFNNLAFFDHYNAVESLARLDPETGKVLWSADSFTADPARSFTAHVLDATQVDVNVAPYDAMGWDPEACCFDLTGDGVPDVLYREMTWNQLVNANLQGPYDNDAHLVLFDGASGAKVWDIKQRGDIPNTHAALRDHTVSLGGASVDVPTYDLFVQPLGDVDHDGAGDVLVRERVFGDRFLHVLTARSGRDGHAIWNRSTFQELAIVPLGDADRDGAGDLLVLDWYNFIGAGQFFDDYDNPQNAHLSVVSGRSGATIWNTTTVEAPSDVRLWLQTIQRNGVMDLDGDGAGEVPVDVVQTMDDQTTIHHRRFLSGADGHEVASLGCIGTFCVPARAPDVDGDGVADVALLSGDMNDLWLTIHAGAGEHKPLWARRVVSIPTSGMAEALPKLRLIGLTGTDGKSDVLVNMHMVTRSASSFILISDTSASEVATTVRSTTPQLLVANATAGAGSWALPRLEAQDVLAAVLGATPGEQAWEKIEAASLRKGYEITSQDAPIVLPGALTGLGVFALVAAVGTIFVRFRRMDEGVPDLD